MKKVFGFTSIRSNSIESLSNDFNNEDALRKELQGKPITVATINAACDKVGFAKYGKFARVHSFYPDAGIAYIGKSNTRDGEGDYARVIVKWDVPEEKDTAIKDLTAQVKALTKAVELLMAGKAARKRTTFGWTAIDSNTGISLCDNYCNWNALRREMQNMLISAESIETACATVGFARHKSDVVKVHSFFPDKGIAYVGIGGQPAVRLEWSVNED